MKACRDLVFAFVACAFLVYAVHVPAQSTSASVTGLVVDNAGALIQGAAIKAVNDATGVVTSTKTNNEGVYYLPSLEPGTYHIQVEKVGFKTLIKPEITLNLQDSRALNFTLPVGATSETVTVEGGGMTINTTDGTVSTVVDSEMVKNMPLNGRSFQDLILLTPGVVTNSPQSKGIEGKTGEFSVDGQRTEANNYTVDGVSVNLGAAPGLGGAQGAGPSGSVAASTALGTTQALVSVDDLAEFRVQSSTYSAEYGRGPGGQFAFETKSGANRWNGTAYDYLRNNYFDANSWFNDHLGTKEPALRQNDFGGTLGGRLRVPAVYDGKDKSFFFLSYEGLRLLSPQDASINYVPDFFLRSSAPSPLNQVLKAFPLPSPNTPDDIVNGVGEYIGSWSNPSSIDSGSARFDQVIGSHVRLFFRFSDTASNSRTRGTGTLTPSVSTDSTYSTKTYTGGATSIAAHWSNQLRLNYSTNETFSGSALNVIGGGTAFDFAKSAGLNPGGAPTVALAYGSFGFVQIQQGQYAGTQSLWNLVDSVGLSLPKHQLKFGVDFRRLTPSVRNPTPLAATYFFSQSGVTSNNGFTLDQVSALAHPLYKNFSAFAQDDWKVSQRLTLALGLRWDVNPAPGVAEGLMPYTVVGPSPGSYALAPQGTPLWKTTWTNLAPRISAAYLLRPNQKWGTVARGGWGVFYDTGQQLGSIGFAGPGFSAQTPFQPGSFGTVTLPTIVNPPKTQQTIVYAFAPHLELPYAQQWNVSVEQGLGGHQSASISYVASHGARLLQENQFATPSNPVAAAFIVARNNLTSDYSSLQVQSQRRLSGGLTALVSYVWSHCMDYGSVNFSIGFQRGNCDFDLRHNLSGALSYSLPPIVRGGIAAAIANHWGIDDRFTARTSFPVELAGRTTIDPLTGNQTSTGLDRIAGQPVYLNGSYPGGRTINPCAFETPSSTKPAYPSCSLGTSAGLVPRNFARGFGAVQMDTAVRREFPIGDTLKLQFRGEAFNIFNHPNFGTVNASYGQGTFGQSTATLANSLGVLSPLYQMGGPRSMQFALKLLF